MDEPKLPKMPSMPLISLPLTNVQFDPNDVLAWILAYITLAPLAIGVSYVVLLARRREPTVAVMLTGQILCSIINALLKVIFKESRPSDLGDGYGMPSGHAAFMFFFATFVTIHLFRRSHFDKPIWRPILSITAIAFASLVAVSRVYLSYHSLAQVLVGGTVGIVFAAAWYAFVDEVVRPGGMFRPLLTAPVAKYLAHDNTYETQYDTL